ncbi:hypothetical protein COX60_01845 [Candidatus Berkelbacteria bacterium CG_4_10_14_0_2_um_filter_35_9_33_12]|uniref:AbrB family transcriptional regulator n=1 Tax=Candidatus Berkelbacteria bacterium CG_4_10_14_0_2_um_filter_35_9_33_12 TaxID=1974499 RepID=A0A2M7W4Y3_9BACT|nr:MAG: hypothetical protein COX60_01845 [Candidatus Berkelbacteria bacterium CG_4_10_14_0_2_um_filter_35_9_33_12]
MTRKCQLTIPKSIRDSLKLKPNLRVVVWFENGA